MCLETQLLIMEMYSDLGEQFEQIAAKAPTAFLKKHVETQKVLAG